MAVVQSDNTGPTSISQVIDHTSGWDWENKHVTGSFTDVNNSPNNISIYDIIEAGTVLIAAGPADISAAAIPNAGANTENGINIVPIGLVETAQINMNKPLSRIFEIGSKLSYIIPGRTVGAISLNRVFFDGPSLLKILYAGEIIPNTESADLLYKYGEFSSSPGASGQYALTSSGNIGMNLASSFFDQPIGLAFFFANRGDNTVGQIYFEGCSISAYNMGISANMNVLTEAINMEFIRCRPIVTTSSNTWVPGQNLADLNIVGPNSNEPGNPLS
jgi:hypothetical protein